MSQEKPIIQVSNVIKDFIVGGRPIRILKGISLEIYEGEFVIIYGPSGCGKSTLLNVINGWERPTQGEVIMKDENLYSKNEDERARLRRGLLAMVHQTSEWIKSLNVLENICIPYLLAGRDKTAAVRRAFALLRLMNLEKYAYYKPMDLSGGQQQRVSLIRALINNPEILLADEPTGNLDTSSSVALMELLSLINENLNRTLIMVSHNMDLLKYANKTINIIDGEIVHTETKPKARRAEKQYKDILDLAFNRFANIKEKVKIG